MHAPLQGRLQQLKAAADAAEAARAEAQRATAEGADREVLLQGRLVELTADAARGGVVAVALRRQVRELLGAAQDAALSQGALQVSVVESSASCSLIHVPPIVRLKAALHKSRSWH